MESFALCNTNEGWKGLSNFINGSKNETTMLHFEHGKVMSYKEFHNHCCKNCIHFQMCFCPGLPVLRVDWWDNRETRSPELVTGVDLLFSHPAIAFWIKIIKFMSNELNIYTNKQIAQYVVWLTNAIHEQHPAIWMSDFDSPIALLCIMLINWKLWIDCM